MLQRAQRRRGTAAAAAAAVAIMLCAVAAAPTAAAQPEIAAVANATDLGTRARRVRKGGRMRIQGVKGLPRNSSLELERFEPFAKNAKVVVQVRPSWLGTGT